jgi:cytochrome c biogenesis protein CcmG, thiol:disulfide interchange protein DsbE
MSDSKPAKKLPIALIVGGLVLALAMLAFVLTRKSGPAVSKTATVRSPSPSAESSGSAESAGSAASVNKSTSEIDSVNKSTSEIAAVTITGATIPALTDVSPDAALNMPVPTVMGTRFDGSFISIGGTSGPAVVLFVAHWCPHCQREVPKVAQWVTDGKRADVSILAVSTAVNKDYPNYPPSAWLKKVGWSVPTLVDDAEKTAANAFGLPGFPYFVAINAEGNVAARTSGEITEEQFDALVAAAKGA